MSVKLPTASATIDGILTNATQTLAGAKTFNDVITFKSAGGTVASGSYDVNGSWTFGPSDSSVVSCLIQGADATNGTLHIKANSASSHIKLERTGTSAGSVWISTSAARNHRL